MLAHYSKQGIEAKSNFVKFEFCKFGPIDWFGFDVFDTVLMIPTYVQITFWVNEGKYFSQ